jgi:hypothetical protein
MEYPHEVMLEGRVSGEGRKGQRQTPVVDRQTIRVQAFAQTKGRKDNMESKFVIQIFDPIRCMRGDGLKDPQKCVKK